MSIRSYFAVKQRDEPELEKVVPSSMAEAVKTEMKRATDAEGGSIERKRGAHEKITPESKAKIAKYAAENGEVAKRSTDTVKSPTILRHCVTIGSRLPRYTLVSLHSFADLLHYYYITYIAYICNIILGT